MFLIVIGIALVLGFIYGMQKLSLNSRERIVCSLVSVIVFLVLTIFISNYIKLRSSYNYSTYITYELTLNQLDEISNTTITDVSSIRELNNDIRTLQNQSSLLIEHLKYTKLVKGLNDQLSHSLKILSNELQTFIVYHNRLFANTNDIQASKIPLYESLIAEASKLYEILDSEGSVSKGNLVGVAEYKVIYTEDRLKRLDETLRSFSEIINEIIE